MVGRSPTPACGSPQGRGILIPGGKDGDSEVPTGSSGDHSEYLLSTSRTRSGVPLAPRPPTRKRGRPKQSIADSQAATKAPPPAPEKDEAEDPFSLPPSPKNGMRQVPRKSSRETRLLATKPAAPSPNSKNSEARREPRGDCRTQSTMQNNGPAPATDQEEAEDSPSTRKRTASLELSQRLFKKPRRQNSSAKPAAVLTRPAPTSKPPKLPSARALRDVLNVSGSDQSSHSSAEERTTAVATQPKYTKSRPAITSPSGANAAGGVSDIVHFSDTASTATSKNRATTVTIDTDIPDNFFDDTSDVDVPMKSHHGAVEPSLSLVNRDVVGQRNDSIGATIAASPLAPPNDSAINSPATLPLQRRQAPVAPVIDLCAVHDSSSSDFSAVSAPLSPSVPRGRVLSQHTEQQKTFQSPTEQQKTFQSPTVYPPPTDQFRFRLDFTSDIPRSPIVKQTIQVAPEPSDFRRGRFIPHAASRQVLREPATAKSSVSDHAPNEVLPRPPAASLQTLTSGRPTGSSQSNPRGNADLRPGPSIEPREFQGIGQRLIQAFSEDRNRRQDNTCNFKPGTSVSIQDASMGQPQGLSSSTSHGSGSSKAEVVGNGKDRDVEAPRRLGDNKELTPYQQRLWEVITSVVKRTVDDLSAKEASIEHVIDDFGRVEAMIREIKGLHKAERQRLMKNHERHRVCLILRHKNARDEVHTAAAGASVDLDTIIADLNCRREEAMQIIHGLDTRYA